MPMQINDKRIIGAVTWKIGSTISRQCSINGKSSSMGPDVGQYMLTVTTSLQSLKEFNGVDVVSIVSVSYTDSAIQSVTFKGVKITLNALVPEPMTFYTFEVQVTAAVRGPRLLQIPRISVPIGSGRKDCLFDIDHLSYTIDETSKTCTIKGLKEGDTTTKLYLPGKVIYRDSTISNLMLSTSVTIYSKAFYDCEGLTNVTIGNGVTSIGEWAFRNCIGLTSVTIPNSVTSIGKLAFCDCSGLTSVIIGNGVTSLGQSTFSGCRSLTSVTIGNGVTSLGQSTFSGCRSLTSVTIPDSVTSIGDYAFSYCRGLTSVTIGNGVTSIGKNAFEYCSGLTSVIIPNSVTSIGYGAFRDCSGLTSVIIPNSVTSIEGYAFRYCSKLSEITFTGTMDQWKNINKSSGWDDNAGNYTIHCTDGDIAK